MVFSTSAFAVFADTAADQDGEQLAKDTPAAEELVNETPEEPAAVTEQAEEVQEQGTEATDNGGVTAAEEPTAETKKSVGIRIGDHDIVKVNGKESDTGWTYDGSGSTKTLTLNNYKAGEYGYIGFYGTDLNIVLVGNNSLMEIINDGRSNKLEISGSGSMTINGSDSRGIRAGTVEIKGGNITIKDVRTGISANNVNISGGELKATNCYYGILASEKISFSGDIHVDIETKRMGSADSPKPAVVSYKEDGIKLSDDVQIVLPEKGKTGKCVDEVHVSEVKKYAGTAITDASGKPAEHVIIEKVAKDRNPSGLLLSKAVAKGKTNMELSWTAMNDVDGYDVFFAPCNSKGKKYEPALVASVDNGTTSYTVSSLKKGTPYKAYVQAYIMKQGSKQYVGTSLLTHAFAGGSSKRFTNPKSVKVKKSKVSVKTGKKYKIRASVRKVKKSKKLIRIGHAPKLRYLSSDTSIATVSKKGKIKGVAPGTCTVYAIAANGVYKAVNVTVK
jgi:predicted DNA binding CopG/RHH family protein